jgi:HNH endonuclease
MSSSVWVQLFYKGKDEPKGQPIHIVASEIKYEGIIARLKEAVKDKRQVDLNHCDPAALVVYSPETTPPFSQDKAIDPGDHVPAGTTSKNPLIVVAPAPKQQQQRLVSCRAWSNEGNHLSYNLQANSYHDLKQQASQKFKFDAVKVTLYYIPNRNDVTSRKKIQGDSDLEDFLQISNTPAVLAWEQGSDGSPTDLPGEIAAPYPGSNVSSVSTSTRGHLQKLFQAAVLERDKQKCVVSGKVYKQGSGNVEAVHIIPVASPLDVRRQAGLYNLYDTCNGMLLDSTLHKAFDSYVWCMDEEGKFCLSDAESHAEKIKDYKLAKWEGNSLNLNIGFDPHAPTKETLKTRYNLFLFEVDKKKQMERQRASRKKNKEKNSRGRGAA